MGFIPKNLAIGSIILNADVSIFATCNDQIVSTIDRTYSTAVQILNAIIGWLMEIKYLNMTFISPNRYLRILSHETHRVYLVPYLVWLIQFLHFARTPRPDKQAWMQAHPNIVLLAPIQEV